MAYTFLVRPPAQTAQDQLLRALERVTEARSRQACPGLWRMTDRLNQVERIPQEVLRRRRRRQKVYGVLLLALGLFGAIPAAMEPHELMSVLVVSLAAIALGIFSLLPRRQERQNRQLLRERDRIFSAYQTLDEQGAAVTFRETGIFEGEQQLGSYETLQEVVFQENIVLLVWQERFLFLQLRDLEGASPEAFRAFLLRKLEEGTCLLEA